jgi:hypothetical protein
MRFRIDDSRGAKDLVRFFRRRGYLAAEVGDRTVEVAPIQSIGVRGDRARTLRDLEAWRAEHPEAAVESLDGPAPV